MGRTRPHARRRDHVVLSPLCPVPGAQPVGYLARTMGPPPDGPKEELARIRWTLEALAVLSPDAFLLAFTSADALADPDLGETLGGDVRMLILPVLEGARMGRRKTQVDAAVVNARRLGLRVAVAGHRVRSASGFDTMVVRPRTAAACLDTAGKPLLVVDVHSEDEVAWATRQGATLMEGRAVGETFKVAPVDLKLLHR